MTTTDEVVRNLMNYFAAIGSVTGRTFSIRDFNTQVMMNAYSPEERECLTHALAALAEADIVRPESPIDYRLTAKGLAEVRAMRRARARNYGVTA
jgi:hypothetical protein